jgi:Protein of unknown function (DUF3168)
VSVSTALQTLIFQRLTGVAGVNALVGARVYDHPSKDVLYPYISFGASDYQPEDFDCIAARTETQQIDVWSRKQDGKRECKTIVDAVKSALHGYVAEPVAGALVDMRVTLVRVMDDPDGITSHGVIQVEMLVEE